MFNMSPMKIFSGVGSEYLAEKIAEKAGVPLGKRNISHFSDGEIQPRFLETVRGDDVYIVQSTFQPIDNLFELLVLVDAARRASAEQIVAVIPYFGYGRQDRKDQPRVAITAKLIANLLAAAGVSRVITMDLHADQIQGFFDVPVDHLLGSALFVPYIQNMNLENLVVASPDTGGSKRANSFSKFLDTDLVICHKTRKIANQVESITVIGDVKDKNVIIVDDMIDTAGTVCKAANVMLEKGARSVRALASHAVLSGDAYERIEKSALTELLVTDSIPLQKECAKIKVISVAELFANVIQKVHDRQSISSYFIPK